MGGHVGKRLYAEKGVHLRYPPHAGWHIGDDVYLARGVVLSAEGDLRIGDRARIMQYTQIASLESITIGPMTLVAEHCSIRDHDHDVSAASMWHAKCVTSPTSIGASAWIGRGVAVLAGAAVGDQSVVGANSVVTRDIPPGVIAFGTPATVHRTRDVTR